jgi:hypothetical protein
MISKAEWQNAYRDDQRKRGAEPPTLEDVEALQRGDLPDDAADRVREQLSHYPELARALTAPFPEDGDALTPQEIEEDIAALRARLVGPAPPLPFPTRRYLPIAAAIVILVAVAGVVLWLATRGSSRATVTRVLYADGSRGAGEQTPIQLSTANDYVLKPLLRPNRQYREYRFELREVTPAQRIIWSRGGVHRESDGSYPVELSTRELGVGRYELVLYGVDESTERLASYTIRLSGP